MKKKSSPPAPRSALPVSKQTAGGVAGAVVGSVLGGPVGAVVGAIAGTIMGNRAAEGKTLVSSETVKTAKNAVDAIKKKVPSLKQGRTPTVRPTATEKPKLTKTQASPKTKPAKRVK